MLVLAVPGLLGGSDYLIQIATMMALYVVLASSLNLIIGFTGMYSLGHGAFYGIGAYTSAILAINLDWTFWVTMPIAGILTALVGAFLGLATLRLRQTFLVFGTLAFGEIVRILIMNWPSLTRGPMGIPGIPPPSILGFELVSSTQYYYLILVFAILMVFLIFRLYHSRVGRAWVAIREDEIAASSMGISVFGYKVLAFTIACLIAGLAGAFYAHFITFISADQFGMNESFLILTMVALGGTGSIIGPIIGALILIIIPEAFRFLAEYRMVLYGALLILVIVVKPEGLAGVKGLFAPASGARRFSFLRSGFSAECEKVEGAK
ncbi:MAG: branched-chain amino acid ABC transporter permease [Deltaproteobacteria bacterium]|nr:branched-chain amino acid ABC transporter permease [Deltaproteobacteria bacterium]